MTSPSGSEQVLSLAWALENVAGFEQQVAVTSVCELFGIQEDQWGVCVDDRTWFVGDGRWHSRELVEIKWNERFSAATKAWLDEDVWHLPLWQLWLTGPKMVFSANLAYLITVSGRGTVARLAQFTGRNRSTVSRWGRWQEKGQKVRLPPSTILPKILEFFDLKPSCNLAAEPFFLGRTAIHDGVLRNQGKYYLGCLSGEHLTQAVAHLREESLRQASLRLGGESDV